MALDYSKNEAPEDYTCSKCGVRGLKLWRPYMTTMDGLELFCARCAALVSGDDISTIGANGVRQGKYGPSDQIGGCVPAVPTMEGTYWGYTSIPPEGVFWWKKLPTISTLK